MSSHGDRPSLLHKWVCTEKLRGFAQRSCRNSDSQSHITTKIQVRNFISKPLNSLEYFVSAIEIHACISLYDNPKHREFALLD